MKATSVRAWSAQRVAATALVGLSAVTLLTGCGFETRQQGAAVVNGEVIHSDAVEETARQLREAQFDFPENIVVTALVASPLLQDAVSESGGWQPDATAANAIAAIPDATDTTKEFINTVAMLQSGQMTDQDVARYRENIDEANITVNPRYGEVVPSEQPPVFFTIGQQRPNWILAPDGE
ncbi:MAG TPA: hypothetical protein VJN29_18665 [Intrasporangium sp.]|uniref:hypothetical protein n=1 Tax=Intrasporangium sp. TaxID=1925024 RepID=UPI002B4A9051|nr:hypothetical protein [Intrasporangium sp.]HKX69243.1 hypothetical protein [Intrasporangium sp.]